MYVTLIHVNYVKGGFPMPSLTLAITVDLQAKMRQFPEMNWSEVARQAIAEKTRILEQLQRVFSKSAITEEDAVKIGKQIKKNIWNKHYKHLAK